MEPRTAKKHTRKVNDNFLKCEICGVWANLGGIVRINKKKTVVCLKHYREYSKKGA